MHKSSLYTLVYVRVFKLDMMSPSNKHTIKMAANIKRLNLTIQQQQQHGRNRRQIPKLVTQNKVNTEIMLIIMNDKEYDEICSITMHYTHLTCLNVCTFVCLVCAQEQHHNNLFIERIFNCPK